MKRLFSVIGLITAFFVPNVQASIYDTSTSRAPMSDLSETWDCLVSGSSSKVRVDLGSCMSLGESYLNSIYPTDPTQYTVSKIVDCAQVAFNSGSTFRYMCGVLSSDGYGAGAWVGAGAVYGSFASSMNEIESRTCPPDDALLYTSGLDTDDDGEIDKCFNPIELDNASNCAQQYNGGTLLTASSSSPDKVCKTDNSSGDSSGSQCAYEKTTYGDNIPVYAINLEANCFDMDPDDEYSEYEAPQPEPAQPQPEQCEPYGSGFVCAEDPSNACPNGVCDDGCGYVNDQFVCFRDDECTGSDCEPPPVNCETNPDSSVCSNPPPVDCSANPSDASCSTDPDPEPCTGDDCGTGGGGGGGFALDYQRLSDLMKDAAKTLIDESEVLDGKEITDQIKEGSDLVDSEFNDFVEHSLFDDIAAIPSQNIFGDMATMLPNNGSCSPIVYAHDATIDICAVSDKLRPILYFVFAFWTLIYLRNLLSSTVRATGAQ